MHNGAGRPLGTALPAEQVRTRNALPDGAPVVLCVAAKRRHKNQALLVRALPLLAPGVVLVLVGHPEPYERELREQVARLGVGDRVRLPGYLEDAELAGLWSLASAAALPTRGEGFGLPLLEAMMRGVPVACSDLPVLREIGGDLPAYFDPASPPDAATAIASVLGDRARGERGRAHAATFSWRRTAEGTYAAYQRALEGGGPHRRLGGARS